MGAGVAIAGAVASGAVKGGKAVVGGVTDGVKSATNNPTLNGQKLHSRIEGAAQGLEGSLQNLIENGRWTSWNGNVNSNYRAASPSRVASTSSPSARRAQVEKQAESQSASIAEQAEAAEEIAELGGDDFAMMMG